MPEQPPPSEQQSSTAMTARQYGRAPVHYPCDQVGPLKSLDSRSSDSSKLHSHLVGEARESCLPPTELLIVEGDSAAKSVDRVRDKRFQAILAVQGKPLNVAKASKRTVVNNAVMQRLAETLLGESIFVGDVSDELTAHAFNRLAEPRSCVYERVVLLTDPDADGIHCGVLLMAFFRRFLSTLIADQSLLVVRPPMFVFRFNNKATMTLSGEAAPWPIAVSPEHAGLVERALRDAGVTAFKKTRHRGLGSLDAETLRFRCVDPETRLASLLELDDVDAAVSLFSGSH